MTHLPGVTLLHGTCCTADQKEYPVTWGLSHTGSPSTLVATILLDVSRDQLASTTPHLRECLPCSLQSDATRKHIHRAGQSLLCQCKGGNTLWPLTGSRAGSARSEVRCLAGRMRCLWAEARASGGSAFRVSTMA